MPRKDDEEAHFFAFVAHETNENEQDMGEPRWRIGNPPLSFKEYRRKHEGCWICYGKYLPEKHDHTTCKIYAEDKRAYYQARAERVPKREAYRGLEAGAKFWWTLGRTRAWW